MVVLPPNNAPLRRRVVVWRVTQTCNLSCRFCAYAADMHRLRGSADPLLVSRIGGLLAEESEATGRGLLLSWIGGEPFLWAPLLPVSTALRDRPGVGLRLTTNGLALSSSPPPRARPSPWRTAGRALGSGSSTRAAS